MGLRCNSRGLSSLLVLTALLLIVSACTSSDSGDGGRASLQASTKVTTPSTTPSALPPTSTSMPAGTRAGQPAPDFGLPSLDGAEIRLSTLAGNTVLLNFWATWCAPCREEMPALDRLYREYRDQHFVVVAVNFGDSPDSVRAYVTQAGYSFPVVLDEDGALAARYQVLGLPTTFIISADGVIRDRVTGAMTAANMQTKAQRFIGHAEAGTGAPGSVFEAMREQSGERAAELEGGQITVGDVNHRVDILLALDRLAGGTVLDPRLPSDQNELKQRRAFALKTLVDETLLADAAVNAGIELDLSAIDQEMALLTRQVGGDDALVAELRTHGVAVEDIRLSFQRGFLANEFVRRVIFSQPEGYSLEEAVQRWLVEEQTRRGVSILLNSG